MIYQGKARYAVHEVILHTSATPGDWWQGKTGTDVLDALWNWHVVESGWRKIGYHRVVMPDGTILRDETRLRSLTEIGAHCKERNRGTIGICLIPVKTVDRMGRFADFYTKDQRSAVIDYIAWLRDMTEIRWVTGHNAYANKLCPGFMVKSGDWMKGKTNG